MKLRLLIPLFLFQLSIAQQRTCGTDQHMQAIEANPEFRQEHSILQEKFEIELAKLIENQMANRTGDVNSVNNTNVTIRIPVAVHFPTVTSTSSTLRACLRSLAQNQINRLNADYRATNADLSNWNSASSFYPGTNTGSMDVQFELATLNHPAGTGIAEGTPAVSFGTDFLTAGDINCTNGCNQDTTWAGYMNFVVLNIPGGTLGFSPVGGTPNTGRTVVIDNNAFGSLMTGSPSSCSGFVPGAPYNLGRTLTHELGHFFNLDHTFKSCDGANCATSGDRVCDTPSTSTPEYNCPAAGSLVSTCGQVQMTMNYMDYPPDACMYMFSSGQTTRMQAWYNTIQSQFLTNVLGNTDFIASNFSIAPNPNNGTFSIQLKEVTNDYAVVINDALGREIYNTEFNQTTDLIQTIQIDTTLSGLYFVTIQSNGATVTKKILVE